MDKETFTKGIFSNEGLGRIPVYGKITLSRLTILLIMVVLLISTFQIKIWDQPKRLIEADVIMYYAYAPAALIYRDLSFEYSVAPENKAKFIDKIWTRKLPNGNRVLKMSMGLAYLYSIPVIIAHQIAEPLGYEADGYSMPYRVSLVFGALLYFLAGLYFLRKILEKYFSQAVTALTILTVVVATNLYNYLTAQPGMPHLYNFTLFAAFIWLTISWYTKQTFFKIVLLGMLLGLISLIRPTNALIIIVFIFWGISSAKEFTDRLKFFISKFGHMAILGVFTLLVWIPQLAFWKIQSGEWLYYSYDNEGFFWGNPQIFNGLFSFRKGWLLYTPVMIFSLLGLAFLGKVKKGMFFPITLFIILNFYIIFSWWCWWYGGSFSSRPLIDSYPLLAIPLAAFFKWAFEKRNRILIISPFFIFFFYFGVLNNFKYYYGSVHFDSMSKGAYFAGFFKIDHPPGHYELLLKPDYELAMKGIYEAHTLKEWAEIEKKQKAEQGLQLKKPEIISVEEYIARISSSPKYMEMVEEKAKERGITIEEMLSNEAGWLHEQDWKKLEKYKELNNITWKLVPEMELQIKNDPKYIKFLEEKALNKGITLEEMIRLDAGWLSREDSVKKCSSKTP